TQARAKTIAHPPQASRPGGIMTEKRASDSRLDELIAEYLREVEAGRPPDRAAMCAAHPEYAEELKSFFADHDRMHRFVEPATIPPSEAGPPAEPSTSVPGGTTGSLVVIRYFGDYELLEEIARGGMGVVFKARQVSLNRIVAVKVILAGQFS